MEEKEATIDIFAEIEAELNYQDERWGHAPDDKLNSPNDWVSYISHHATRWFSGGFAPYKAATVDTFRTQMVKVAALAISAIKSIDRQRAAKGRPFYQE